MPRQAFHPFHHLRAILEKIERGMAEHEIIAFWNRPDLKSLRDPAVEIQRDTQPVKISAPPVFIEPSGRVAGHNRMGNMAHAVDEPTDLVAVMPSPETHIVLYLFVPYADVSVCRDILHTDILLPEHPNN